ncbi:MAG: cysteine synthase family protein [Bacteroidota bacterium]
MAINSRIQGLTSLIGNTPLIVIDFEYKGENRKIYAKAENMNMTGSIKDRMAFHILNNAILNGKLTPESTIIEATSGNTGISIAALGRALGHPVTIFMPNWMSSERINLIKGFGATIHLISKEEGGFLGSIDKANELAASLKDSFLPCQFSNIDNTEAHYLTTAPELWWQLKFRNLKLNAFVAGVGTGGTVMGMAKFLKENDPTISVHPLEPANSPTLTTGYKVGKHRIQGISDEFIPSIVELNKLDSIVSVDDGDSIIMAQKLANVGLGVGISSGANFIGALKIQNQLGADAIVATVFPDDNKKYLSTDLLKTEPIKEGFYSPDIKITKIQSYKRVCQTCCSPANCDEAIYFNKTTGPGNPCCPLKN